MYSYKRKNIFIKNNKFIFNEHNLSNLVVVENVQRTVLPEITNENKQVPGRYGSVLLNRQVGSRLITVSVRIIEQNKEQVKKMANEVALKLYSNKPERLELKDSDLFNYATLISTTDLQTLAHTGRVELLFECHDPFNYGEEKVVTDTDSIVNDGYDAVGLLTIATDATDKITISQNGNPRLILNTTFKSGNKLIVDLDKRLITLNDNIIMNKLNLESDFFKIPTGNSSITVDSGNIKELRFRERWL